jgi:hypothetical protein
MGLDRPDDVDEVISPDPNFLSTAQCAALLGNVGTAFVIGEIREGRLAALVIERPGLRTIYRITERQLADYMDKYRWTPPAA